MPPFSHSQCLSICNALQNEPDFASLCMAFDQHLKQLFSTDQWAIFGLDSSKNTWSNFTDCHTSLVSGQSRRAIVLTLELKNALVSTIRDPQTCSGYFPKSGEWLLPFSLSNNKHFVVYLKLPLQLHIDEELQTHFSQVVTSSFKNAFLQKLLREEKADHSGVRHSLDKTLNDKNRLLEQFHTLHKISQRLWNTQSMDNMLHTAVYECVKALDFDRMAIFLLHSHSGLVKGTYGTDTKGKVVSEHHYVTSIHEHPIAQSTLDRKQLIAISEDTILTHGKDNVGYGWNGFISLWDGREPLGWIACDNLLSGTPLKDYHHQLLKFLGITLSQHLIHQRSQGELKTLNQSLEMRVAQRTTQLESANKMLEKLSREDSLTGLLNRRALDEIIDIEWRRAQRHQTPISMLIIDIDFLNNSMIYMAMPQVMTAL
nr:GGDEF domain-containing protein [Veronia nyctiphanis]